MFCIPRLGPQCESKPFLCYQNLVAVTLLTPLPKCSTLCASNEEIRCFPKSQSPKIQPHSQKGKTHVLPQCPCCRSWRPQKHGLMPGAAPVLRTPDRIDRPRRANLRSSELGKSSDVLLGTGGIKDIRFVKTKVELESTSWSLIDFRLIQKKCPCKSLCG